MPEALALTKGPYIRGGARCRSCPWRGTSPYTTQKQVHRNVLHSTLLRCGHWSARACTALSRRIAVVPSARWSKDLTLTMLRPSPRLLQIMHSSRRPHGWALLLFGISSFKEGHPGSAATASFLGEAWRVSRACSDAASLALSDFAGFRWQPLTTSRGGRCPRLTTGRFSGRPNGTLNRVRMIAMKHVHTCTVLRETLEAAS